MNTKYAEGLQLIRALADAAVDTRTTAGLPIEQRRLNVTDRWPLVIDDPVELQRRLGAKGGNSTRRIRLWVDGLPEASGLVGILSRSV